MYNTDIHTHKPCCHTGCKLQMCQHMQSTYKAHRKPCYHMVIACQTYVEKNYKSLVTCKAHENPCNHMVITGENHVNANYKCLVTCKTHVTHITRHINGNYGQKPCGCEVEFLVTCYHMVITGGSHVEANYKFLVS